MVLVQGGGGTTPTPPPPEKIPCKKKENSSFRSLLNLVPHGIFGPGGGYLTPRAVPPKNVSRFNSVMGRGCSTPGVVTAFCFPDKKQQTRKFSRLFDFWTPSHWVKIFKWVGRARARCQGYVVHSDHAPAQVIAEPLELEV